MFYHNNMYCIDLNYIYIYVCVCLSLTQPVGTGHSCHGTIMLTYATYAKGLWVHSTTPTTRALPDGQMATNLADGETARCIGSSAIQPQFHGFA